STVWSGAMAPVSSAFTRQPRPASLASRESAIQSHQTLSLGSRSTTAVALLNSVPRSLVADSLAPDIERKRSKHAEKARWAFSYSRAASAVGPPTSKLSRVSQSAWASDARVWSGSPVNTERRTTASRRRRPASSAFFEAEISVVSPRHGALDGKEAASASIFTRLWASSIKHSRSISGAGASLKETSSVRQIVLLTLRRARNFRGQSFVSIAFRCCNQVVKGAWTSLSSGYALASRRRMLR